MHRTSKLAVGGLIALACIAAVLPVAERWRRSWRARETTFVGVGGRRLTGLFQAARAHSTTWYSSGR